MFGTLVAQHRLRGAQFSYLQSGYSHEDIDDYFSVVSSYLERHKESGIVVSPGLPDLLANHAGQSYRSATRTPQKGCCFRPFQGLAPWVWVVNKNIVFF